MNNEYLSCDVIEYGFDAQVQSIDLCCRVSGDNFPAKSILINKYKGEKINWESFFEKKNFIRNIYRNGGIYKPCEGCIYLNKNYWDSDNYIRVININNWIKCNAKCIYCKRAFVFSKLKEYKILPVFKDMIKKNILRNGGPITISGGEPTINREFEPLLNIFLKKKMENIKVLTNGIKYSRAIEKGLKIGLVTIVISIDSGTRSLYKFVKGVDKYNDVWKNIKKYTKSAKEPALVRVKYIVIPEVNDTFEEIDAFINESKTNGVKNIQLDIEIDWFYENKNDKNKLLKIYELYLYACKRAKEFDIDLEPKDRMVLLLNCL